MFTIIVMDGESNEAEILNLSFFFLLFFDKWQKGKKRRGEERREEWECAGKKGMDERDHRSKKTLRESKLPGSKMYLLFTNDRLSASLADSGQKKKCMIRAQLLDASFTGSTNLVQVCNKKKEKKWIPSEHSPPRRCQRLRAFIFITD